MYRRPLGFGKAAMAARPLSFGWSARMGRGWEGRDDWWSSPLPSCVSFPPFPSLGFPFPSLNLGLWREVCLSFQDPMDLHQLNAIPKLRACHLCLDCPNKCRLSGHLCITISPPAIHRMSALLACTVLALVTVAITKSASHLGVQPFLLKFIQHIAGLSKGLLALMSHVIHTNPSCCT